MKKNREGETRKKYKNDSYKMDFNHFLGEVINSPLVIPVIVMAILFVINRSSYIYNIKLSESVPKYDIVLFVGSILIYSNIVVLLMVYTSKAVIFSHRKQIEKECVECVKAKENEGLNAYNLYTYNQILQIERTLTGPDSAVYCYSLIRNDGQGAGLDEAEKVIQDNIKKGIKYYFIYYVEPPNSNASNVDSKGQTYIALSQVYKDIYENFLDYRIYRDSDFDIMIYKHVNIDTKGSQVEEIEGYMALNFPWEDKEAHLCAGCDRKNCPLKMKGSFETDNIIYKKMPYSIATALYKRLESEVKKDQKID